jgi:hypothetical protein
VKGPRVNPMAVVGAVPAGAVVVVTMAMAMAHQEGGEIVNGAINRAIGLVNAIVNNQRRRRRPIRPKKKSRVCCLLRLTPSRGQLEGNIAAYSSPVVV